MGIHFFVVHFGLHGYVSVVWRQWLLRNIDSWVTRDIIVWIWLTLELLVEQTKVWVKVIQVLFLITLNVLKKTWCESLSAVATLCNHEKVCHRYDVRRARSSDLCRISKAVIKYLFAVPVLIISWKEYYVYQNGVDIVRHRYVTLTLKPIE